MRKRGQVAIFVVIGIVIVILFVLIFTFSETLISTVKSRINTQQYLNDELKAIQEEVIEKCAVSETLDAVKLFLRNGGKFSEPLNYLKYNGEKHRILCQNIPGKSNCLSNPLSLENTNAEFNEYLKEKFDICMDFSEFSNKNYELNLPSELSLNVEANKDSMIVDLDYVVELSKDEFNVKGKKVVKNIDIPLGELIKAVNGVLEFRSNSGFFDPVLFGLVSHSKYIAEVKKPYPDEVYDVWLRENQDYHFVFAVTEEGRYDRTEGSR